MRVLYREGNAVSNKILGYMLTYAKEENKAGRGLGSVGIGGHGQEGDIVSQIMGGECLERVSVRAMWEKSIPARGNSQC